MPSHLISLTNEDRFKSKLNVYLSENNWFNLRLESKFAFNAIKKIQIFILFVIIFIQLQHLSLYYSTLLCLLPNFVESKLYFQSYHLILQTQLIFMLLTSQKLKNNYFLCFTNILFLYIISLTLYIFSFFFFIFMLLLLSFHNDLYFFLFMQQEWVLCYLNI